MRIRSPVEAFLGNAMTNDVPIRDVLVPALVAAFPGSGMRLGGPPDPVAVFPAACAEVGDVLIYDDGDEVTVVIERVTHHHSSAYDEGLTCAEKARTITDDVVEFLNDLFSDRVFLWSRESGQGGGGWRRPWEGGIPDDVPRGVDMFVWSGRIRAS